MEETNGVCRACPSGHPKNWGPCSISRGCHEIKVRCVAHAFTEGGPRAPEACKCLVTKTVAPAFQGNREK